MSVRGYRLAFDWSRNGIYTGTLEDITSYLTEDDLSITVGRDTTQAAAAIPAGTLDFQITEKTDPGNFQFAPESTTSSIANKILPGVPGVMDLTIASQTFPIYTGVLDSFTYDPDARTLTGQLRDAWGTPSDQKLSTIVYQGMRTGDLITVILNAIGWPAGARSIDPGATVVPYWWEEGTDAATAVQKLVDSEGPPAIAYVYAGVFYFRDRHHRITQGPSLNSQATFTARYPQNTGSSTDYKILDGSFSYTHGRENLINTVSFQIDQRLPGPPAPIWSSDAGLIVPAGQTITQTVTANDPFISAQTPKPVTQFDANGQPLFGDYIIASGGIASIAIDRTSGQSLTLTIVGGGSDTVFSYIQVQAVPLSVVGTTQVNVSDAGSVSAKGSLTWPNSVPWANAYDALAIARNIVTTYSVARPVLTFDIDCTLITNAGLSYLYQFVNRAVSDRVTIRHDLASINGDYYIEKVVRIAKALGKDGTILRLTCEAMPPTGATNPFTFGVAGKGFDQGQFDADGISHPGNVFRFDLAGHGFDQGVFAA